MLEKHEHKGIIFPINVCEGLVLKKKKVFLCDQLNKKQNLAPLHRKFEKLWSKPSFQQHPLKSCQLKPYLSFTDGPAQMTLPL